jgi:putative salt-induced outer membrane protein YdiY
MMRSKLKNLLLLILFWMSFVSGFSGQAAEVETQELLWSQFVPPIDEKFDWIQLDSGEWLKGEFKTLYDHVLLFDSEEMDLQEFDFEDVKRLRTRKPQKVLIGREKGSRGTLVEQGVLEIIGDQVFLQTNDEDLELSRKQLVSIATGEKSRLERWSGTIAFGMNKRGGNSESTDSTMAVNLQRSMARSRFDADYLGIYSSTDGDKTVDNHRLITSFDWFLTTHSYWEILYAEYYRDTFINIDAQISLGTGYGYDLVRTPKTELSLNTGIGYQEQQYVSVGAGEADHSGSPILTGGFHFDRDLTRRIEVLLDYNMRLLNEDNGRYTHHSISTVSIDLIADFDIDFSYIWDRIEKPQPDSSGELPDQDDYQFIVSIAYDF